MLYAETSCLVATLVEGSHSPIARRWFSSGDTVAASIVVFPEAHSAIERLRRGGVLSDSQAEDARDQLEAWWRVCRPVVVDAARAADMVRAHGLRALDAIHLAAALTLSDVSPSLRVASFDRQLCAAAATEGLTVLDVDAP